jgi:uncharacterized Zn finger protein (UPF0148 family)
VERGDDGKSGRSCCPVFGENKTTKEQDEEEQNGSEEESGEELHVCS